MALKRNNYQRWGPLVFVLFLLVALYGIKLFKSDKPANADEQKEVVVKGLNRNPARIEFSRHALCRMECRHINEKEVEQILKEGKINYRKSEIGQLPDCRRKYAVEGITYEDQKVRIIFAPCGDEVTVVTVIDIGQDWPCECN